MSDNPNTSASTKTNPDEPDTPPASTIKKTPTSPPAVKFNVKMDDEGYRRLQKELEQAHGILKAREAELEQKQAELDKVAGEKTEILEKQEQLQSQLTAIALERFEAEKKALIDMAKERGLSEDKINQIKEKIEQPKDLETTKYFIDLLVESAKKGPQTPPPASPEQPGQATIKRPSIIKSRTGLKLEFESPAQLGKYLYDVKNRRVSINGKPPTEEQQAEAEKMIEQLWYKMQVKGTQVMGPVKIAECPRCHSMMSAAVHATCPICGWNPKSPPTSRKSPLVHLERE